MRRRVGRALRTAGWNAVWLIAGLVLIAVIGETWLRLTLPFPESDTKYRFVPGVGSLYRPNTDSRHTNGLDFWAVNRVNRWGFIDREPPNPDRAAESCHVAMIGDSFVRAGEVPLADKFHVRLEALARRRLPDLDVTTSAFGRSGTGQIHQLPYYDHYARRLRPKLLVLVFVANDFTDNAPNLYPVFQGFDPERMPYSTAVRGADGAVIWRPPDPEWKRFQIPLSAVKARSFVRRVTSRSWLGQWLTTVLSTRGLFRLGIPEETFDWLSRRPGHVWLLDDPFIDSIRADTKTQVMFRLPLGVARAFAEERWSPVLKETVEFTRIALDQFKARADRDGAALAILATHAVRVAGEAVFERLRALAEPRGIPIIDQYAWIVRSGGAPGDATWANDGHWNEAGHRWAAEALLEYLEQHPEVCAPHAS